MHLPERTVKTREELSELLVSYMKGEITTLEYTSQTVWYNIPPRNLIEAVSAATCFGESDEKICVTKDDWDFFRRCLAILQTDYEVSSHQLKLYEVSLWLNILILLFLVAGYFLLSQYFVGIWVACGLIWFIAYRSADKKTQAALETDSNWRNYVDFGPFLSQEDWLAHAHLIDKFNLPEYDAKQYEKRLNTSKSLSAFNQKIVLLFLIIIFIPLIVVFLISTCWRKQTGSVFFRVEE